MEQTQETKIQALIVLYNTHLADSMTFRSIRDTEGIFITIADNSTRDFKNAEAAREAGCRYINMQGNKGLSKAYNKAIAGLEKNEDLLCLFDEDARVGENYFSALREAAESRAGVDIFVPVVRDKKGMLSPCIFQGLTGRRAKRLRDIPKNRLSAINCGMAIRLRVFKEYIYDEGLFLDYIDHAFIRDTVHTGRGKLYVMENALIRQTFADSEPSDSAADNRRFAIYKRDTAYFCKKYQISSFRKNMHLLKRKIKLLLKK